MKEYNKDLDIVFSPMSDETMSWLDELFSTCKRFGVDYYNASEKDRVFVEAVARKNYGLKQKSCFYRGAVLWDSPSGIRFSGSSAVENAPPYSLYPNPILCEKGFGYFYFVQQFAGRGNFP